MKKIIISTSSFAISLVLPLVAWAANGVVVPSNTGLPSGSLFTVIESLMKWLLGIFGFLAIISFIISGIMYLTAAGDEDQQKKAKKQMQWSIVGVIVGLSGFIVIKAVDAWLRGNNIF